MLNCCSHSNSVQLTNGCTGEVKKYNEVMPGKQIVARVIFTQIHGAPAVRCMYMPCHRLHSRTFMSPVVTGAGRWLTCAVFRATILRPST